MFAVSAPGGGRVEEFDRWDAILTHNRNRDGLVGQMDLDWLLVVWGDGWFDVLH